MKIFFVVARSIQSFIHTEEKEVGALYESKKQEN